LLGGVPHGPMIAPKAGAAPGPESNTRAS
jgi:hypothetical protein